MQVFCSMVTEIHWSSYDGRLNKCQPDSWQLSCNNLHIYGMHFNGHPPYR